MGKPGTEGNCLSVTKAIYDKLVANIILNGDRLKAFPLRSGNRQEGPLSPLSLSIILVMLATANRLVEVIRPLG